MKRGKKLLCTLLAVLLLAGCLPMGALAALPDASLLERIDAYQARTAEAVLEVDAPQLAAEKDAVSTLVNYIQSYGEYDSDTGTKYYFDTVASETTETAIIIFYDPSKNILSFGCIHRINGDIDTVMFDYDVSTRSVTNEGISVQCNVSSSRAEAQAPINMTTHTHDADLPFKLINSSGGLPELSLVYELCNAVTRLSFTAWELSLRQKLAISLYDFGFVSLFLGIIPTPDPGFDPTPNLPSFTDVKNSDYFYNAVQWAVEKEITSGTDKTHFSPNASCTRAQAVTFLWRAAGEPEPQGTAAGFTDVKAGAYYEKAVQWAVEQGITAGTGVGKFSPEVPCTRAQIVTFLWRKEGTPEAAGAAFGDVQPGAYYETAVKWAVEQGITAGTSATTFSPESRCTRAQIVSFLYRYQG